MTEAYTKGPAIESRALHFCMMALVALNLVFVALTEAAGLEWLLPLFGLTLASPLLARFKESRVYRSLWNLAVVGFFGILIQHALSAQLASVLQDGLILAVLCQVHLLNNLHSDQRPDLLFLNSYLIAIITGYITVDLGFSGAFLVYAPFYILGLQFLSVFRPGRSIDAAEVKAVALDGLGRSAVLLALALLAFLFWPRDFQREALFAKYFDFEQTTEAYEIDFSETLDLEKRGRAQANGRVVMTATLREGSRAGVPELWRGAALDEHDRSGSWRPSDRQLSRRSPAADRPWWTRRGGLGLERRDRDPDAPGSVVLDVVRAGGGTLALFLPGGTERIELDRIHTAGKLRAQSDGAVRYTNPGELRYRLTLADAAPSPREPLSDSDRARFLSIEDSPHTRTAADLARRLRERFPEGATESEVARGFSGYLQDRYSYALPGEESAAGTLHEFLTTDAGGHCEYFASTLALMLRAVDVPARVVTGYRAHAWDDQGGSLGSNLEISSLDAHAWVEAFTEEAGWLALDPTPAVDLAAEGPGLFDRAQEALASFWSKVTGFDAASRAAAVAWARELPRRALAAISKQPFHAGGGVIVLLALVVALRDRRLGRTPVEIRTLQAAARSAGIELLPNETPRELLARAEPLELAHEKRAALETAVVRHERTRYAAC